MCVHIMFWINFDMSLMRLQETMSTCRFAQRVALIKNDAILNEELDPKLIIVKLKKEVQQLKEELLMATGEQRTDSLSEEDLDRSGNLEASFYMCQSSTMYSWLKCFILSYSKRLVCWFCVKHFEYCWVQMDLFFSSIKQQFISLNACVYDMSACVYDMHVCMTCMCVWRAWTHTWK